MDKRKQTRLIVSANIKHALQEQKITRTTASKDLNIKYSRFCDWLRGRTFPKENELKQLADYLGLNMTQVYDSETLPEELSLPLKFKLLKEEFKKKNNIIKFNDRFYIKMEKLERILNNE